MIVASPESDMPEPYNGYIEARAIVIARTLEAIVGEVNVQLCPRAILPSERHFGVAEQTTTDALIYGCVVKQREDGDKSVLHKMNNGSPDMGIVAHSRDAGLAYAETVLRAGNRVRNERSTRLRRAGTIDC